MNNADKIRNMSDDELALMLMCPFEYDLNFKKACNGNMNNNCYECTKRWLKENCDGRDE
nr:hypothetical protein [uncultured Anaerocolumna sp.]